MKAATKQVLTLTGFILVMLACNLHLLSNVAPSNLIFDKQLVAQGEWWRIITHPFVHVSWYHLLLDSAALLMLWYQIELSSVLKKIFAVVICAAGSLLFACYFSPFIDQVGLCGFSGSAHGLTFFLGLTWMAKASAYNGSGKKYLLTTGGMLALVCTIKSIFELISGQVIFSGFHLGDLSVPIVESHFGGVIGGFSAFILLWLIEQKSFGINLQKTHNKV